MYSLGDTASELYRAYVEKALFEESSLINAYPEAGDTNAVALIKSSFRDGVPEVEKVLNLESDTNLTFVVRNLALAEYVRRQELDLERIKSIPAKDWERIDYLTYMAMPPSELGFEILSQLLSEYPEQEIPENDLAFVCAQYLCEGRFMDRIYKNLMTAEWSSYFSDLHSSQKPRPPWRSSAYSSSATEYRPSDKT